MSSLGFEANTVSAIGMNRHSSAFIAAKSQVQHSVLPGTLAAIIDLQQKIELKWIVAVRRMSGTFCIRTSNRKDEQCIAVVVVEDAPLELAIVSSRKSANRNWCTFGRFRTPSTASQLRASRIGATNSTGQMRRSPGSATIRTSAEAENVSR